MRLKEILLQQQSRKSHISKDITKIHKHLRKRYSLYHFKNNVIVEFQATNTPLQQYVLVDLLDFNEKIIVTIDNPIRQSEAVILEIQGYHIIDLYGQKKKKKLLHSQLLESRERTDDLTQSATATLVGGLRDDVDSNVTNVLSLLESREEDIKEEASIDITELIGRSPNWILRSGIGIVGIALFIALAIAHVIKYPDKIISAGYITTTSPPISLKAGLDGVISAIYVDNESTVHTGDELFYLKNTAERTDINKVLEFVHNYNQSDKLHFVLGKNPPERLKLGDLQHQYAQFKLTYQEFQQVLRSSNVNEQISSINTEINRTNQLINILGNERSLFQQELALNIKDQERNKKLNQKGIVSDLEYEKVLITETQSRRQLESMNNGVVQNEIKIEQLQLQTKQLLEERNSQINNYQFVLAQLISQLEEIYEKWKNQYIISAEGSGIIHYSNSLQTGQSISHDNNLAYISSENDNKKILTAHVHESGIGKLSKGSKVIIAVEAYPQKEYGTVVSTIQDISKLPIHSDGQGEYYEVRASLNNRIVTDYGEVISFSPRMKATASFISEDKSVLDRVFDQIINLLN